MQECGFVHRGLSTDINAYFQPRFNMAIPLFNENGPIDSAGFLKAVPKKTRYYMGSFHNSKGIEFIKADPDDDLSEFVRLLGQTEKRQGISLRNEEYFKRYAMRSATGRSYIMRACTLTDMLNISRG